VKIHEGSSDLSDEKADTGMNPVADNHPQPSSSDLDCSHQSGTATTTAKLAGGQITE